MGFARRLIWTLGLVAFLAASVGPSLAAAREGRPLCQCPMHASMRDCPMADHDCQTPGPAIGGCHSGDPSTAPESLAPVLPGAALSAAALPSRRLLPPADEAPRAACSIPELPPPKG